MKDSFTGIRDHWCSRWGNNGRLYGKRYTSVGASLPKQIRWVGSSLTDLRRFPKSVQRHVGRVLFAAQSGIEHPDVKALQGFGGRSVLEICTDENKNTWRTVYTVRFADIVYVLHAFQKKSKSGIATPRRDMDLILSRLAAAERDHRERQN